MNRATRHAKKVGIGIIGGIIVLAGIIAIPYPGPGWLMVFAGLAILATEFDSAQRILDRLRVKYDNWMEWLRRQSNLVRFVFFLITSIVVIATIYLFNGYGYLNDFLRLDFDWVDSPLPLFN